MKKSIVAIAVLGLSLVAGTAQAVEINYNQSWGTSSSVATVNQKVEGKVSDVTVQYSTTRGSVLAANACQGGGEACKNPGAVTKPLNQVTTNIGYTQKDTQMNETTTGTSSTDSSFCTTTVDTGLQTAGNTANKSTSSSVLDTKRNNVTTIVGKDITVSTTSDGKFSTGNGDDFIVKVDGVEVVEQAQNTSSDIGQRDVSVNGMVDALNGKPSNSNVIGNAPAGSNVTVEGTGGGTGATTEGFKVNVVDTKLTVTDTTTVKTTSNGGSFGSGSFIK